MKKKFVSVIMASMMLLSVNSFAGEIPKVYLDYNARQPQKILMVQPPMNINGIMYVPVRSLEQFGFKVKWDGATKTVTLFNGAHTIEQRVGDKTARLNSKVIDLGATCVEKNGTAYVPLKFFRVALGAETKFDGKANSVTVKYGDSEDEVFSKSLKRTSSLPRNASDFSYIKNGIPNAMYEVKRQDQIMDWKIKPVEGEHFIRPVNLQKSREMMNPTNIQYLKTMLEKNLDLRLNVSYKSINKSWSDSLKSTYSVNRPEAIDKYSAYVKNNKLEIVGDYFVEPTMTYMRGEVYFRVYVNYMIKSSKVSKASLYQDAIGEVKTNVWHKGYIDIGVAGRDGGMNIETYVVMSDYISDMPSFVPVK